MSGLIELQQIFSNTNSIDKAQHISRENQLVQEQFAVAQLKEEDKKKRTEVNKGDETEGARIRQKNRNRGKDRKRKADKQKRPGIDGDDDKTQYADESCGHNLDIIV